MWIDWASNSVLFDLRNILVMVAGSGNDNGELLVGAFDRVLTLVTLEILLGRFVI